MSSYVLSSIAIKDVPNPPANNVTVSTSENFMKKKEKESSLSEATLMTKKFKGKTDYLTRVGTEIEHNIMCNAIFSPCRIK